MPAKDLFGAPTTFDAPAYHAEVVTPSDSNDIAVVSRALFIGGAGNLAVIMGDGSSATFVGALAGSILPLAVSRVLATGTTATSIVALW